jgi:predicted deacylase
MSCRVLGRRLCKSLETKLDQLKGTIIAIPSLNPTGHLQGTFWTAVPAPQSATS